MTIKDLFKPLPSLLLCGIFSVVFGMLASPVSAEPKAISAELAPLLEKAYNQLKDGNSSQAVSTLKKAIKVDKDSITARRYYAFALVQDNQPANAIKQLNIIVEKLNKPTYFEWCTFGEAYLAAGGIQQAQNCYEQALKIAPKSSYVKSGLIRANAMTRNYDEALKIAENGMKDSKSKENYDYFKLLYAKVRGQQMERGDASIPAPRTTGEEKTAQAPTSATPAQQAKARAEMAKNMDVLEKITSSQKKPVNHPGG